MYALQHQKYNQTPQKRYVCIYLCVDHGLRRNMSLGQILWATKKADEGGGGRAVNTLHQLWTLVDLSIAYMIICKRQRQIQIQTQRQR